MTVKLNAVHNCNTINSTARRDFPILIDKFFLIFVTDIKVYLVESDGLKKIQP